MQIQFLGAIEERNYDEQQVSSLSQMEKSELRTDEIFALQL